MTVNDRLRQAGEQVRSSTREVDLPPVPHRRGPRILSPLVTTMLVIGMLGVTVWLAADAPPSPPATTVDGPPGGGLAEVWQHASAAIGIYPRPSHDFLTTDRQAYVLEGEDAGGLAALDLEAGETVWRLDLPDQPLTILAAPNGDLLTATYERIDLRTEDGDTVWFHDFGNDGRWPSLALTDPDHVTIALDPVMEGDERPPLIVRVGETGSQLWATELQGANRDEDLQWSDMLLEGRGVIMQTTDALYRLDLDTGIQEWRFPFAEAQVESIGRTGTILHDGTVYAADPAGEFSGLDGGQIVGVAADDGDIHLAFRTGMSPRVVGVLGRWLVHSDESGVRGQSLDSRDLWTYSEIGALATIFDDRVIAVSEESLATLDGNGEVLSELEIDGVTPQLAPVVVGDTVFVSGLEGNMAYDLTTGALLHEWPADYFSPVLDVDGTRALVGIARQGVNLVATR